jgi:two-component system nitrate/nitrite response regulator NarL
MVPLLRGSYNPTVTAPLPARGALIADDHLLVRSGVRLLLQSLGFEVQGEAGDGQQLIDLHARHRPGFLIVDVTMPVKSGLQALAKSAASTRRAHDRLNLDTADAINLAFASGAVPTWSRTSRCRSSAGARRHTQRGDKYLSPRLTGVMLAGLGSGQPATRCSRRARSRSCG